MQEKEIINAISINARSLNEDQRRLLYSKILSLTLGNQSLNKHKTIYKTTYEMDSCLVEKWNKISDLVNIGINEFGVIFVWKIYSVLCRGKISETLGQYFTNQSLVNFMLSSLRNPKRILDPMAGHGAFLLEASNRFKDSRIFGVEIDPLPLEAAQLVLRGRVELINDDIFTWASNHVTEDSKFSFDAIIGNPAYISYQNLQRVGDFGNLKTDYRKYILNILKKIARAKGVEIKLNHLFKNWSGYSDLAVYTLVLSWLLLGDAGQIAFVTTNHWLERKYGENVRRFLATHGTIHGIIIQRNGGWFPHAQIPTNVFIYVKEKASKRQRKKGIPYIEILEKNVRDIKGYLDSVTDGNFWFQLRNINERKNYDNVRIFFRKWFESEVILRDYYEKYRSQNINMPDHLERSKLFSFDSIGWDVHQGLRTGCNEVFYVKKSRLEPNSYVATVTRNGKKKEKKFQLPFEVVIPSIQKITSNDPLRLDAKNTDTYLLYLEHALLREDFQKVKSMYPKKWIEKWKTECDRLIPLKLAEHLHECSMTPYEGKGYKRKPASELSAVRTNVYNPPLKNINGIPPRPKFWYQIKVQPRHFGKIIIPRVSGRALRSYLIIGSKKILTDANFVTIIPKEERLSAKYLWIWLNSNTFRLLAEMNGVILGGGALKLETSIIKKLPVPHITIKKKKERLKKLSSKLGGSFSDSELLDKGEEIDSILFENVDSSSIRKRLTKYIKLRQINP